MDRQHIRDVLAIGLPIVCARRSTFVPNTLISYSRLCSYPILGIAAYWVGLS